ncbi:MAG: exodeoxyribonuclease I [Rubrivivax sp.]|nr:exodeoxyribonuclease I [Rubrivivax sp.]
MPTEPLAAQPPLTFYWHDYETFGKEPRRDRPAQFAGVRTDAALNEVGEPLVLYCRPTADYLPDPESVLLTGITPQAALERGVAECEFAARIEAELAREGTVGVGYNSIRFDDEVTRHLFWRNLIDPYAREWSNGCARWDLLDVVRTCWALRPEGIEWPAGDDGRASFALARLTAANGLQHEAAHDALSDVRATIALARRVKAQQPKLWDFCFKLRKKDAVWEEIGAGRPFVHLSGRYPVERGCLAVVWPLAPHPVNRNELIVWDLAQDPGELADLDAEGVKRRLYTRAEALPEGEQRLPIKTIHVNRSPVVIGNVTRLGRAGARFGIDLAAALRHAERAAALPDLSALWQQVFTREAPPPGTPATDVDEDLYGGFLGNEDRRLLNRLRQLGAEALARQVAEGRVAFNDARLEELLFRYRARNFPTALAEEERERWQAHCAARLHEGRGGALTLAAYQERIDALGEAAGERDDPRALALLEALSDYALEIAPEPPSPQR